MTSLVLDWGVGMEKALFIVFMLFCYAVVGVVLYKQRARFKPKLMELISLVVNSPKMVELREQRAAQQAAGQAYKDALDVLKSTKTADARINALEAGRAYVRLCREDGREAIFDEMMLQNDLSAYGAKD